MKTIVCKVSMFDLHQEICLVDGDETKVIAISHTSSLGPDVAMMCEKHDVDNVHLFGNEDYLQQAIAELRQENVVKYGNRNLNIEVN